MPLTARVLELADQLLRLGVDADRGLVGSDRLADRVVEMPELGVAIGVLVAPATSCAPTAG
jgi:hypothetical protein